MQSEFLQLLTFVVLTTYLIYRGSHESKDSDLEMQAALERIEARVDPLAAKEAHEMARKTRIHTVPHGDRWANYREGSLRVSNTAPTKAEAQEKGREMAKAAKTEHVIHNKDGSIGSRNSYGNDPHPPKG